MTDPQNFLERACRELGLSIVAPFRLTLHPGVEIAGKALLPQLGAPKGMIIVSHLDSLCGMAPELTKLGYGYSVLSGPLPTEEFDLRAYMDMFSDWGWGVVNEVKPRWMV